MSTEGLPIALEPFAPA